MVTRVRYLNSAGIMAREIPGIAAIADAYPSEWLLYASLNCYPRNQSPMEIDAVVVLDDRVLVLELKDWNGKLTQKNDKWFVNGSLRGRSAVLQVEEKAKKLKTVISTEIPSLKSVWVDFRVVLTASATKQHLPTEVKSFVWSLQEARSIADSVKRAALLQRTAVGLFKTFQFEKDFDRLTGNSRIFQPAEADWGGFRVVAQDLVTHPRGVWREHGAERKGEPRIKALVRIWAFDKLPPGLNSPERRQFIAHREMKVVAHLTALGSRLVDDGGILRHLGDGGDQILTQHYELRSISYGWSTLDRYLQRMKEDLSADDRLAAATTFLALIAELHRHGIAHRDIGPRCIWVGDPTRIALSGLMSSYIPAEESLADWFPHLRGYSASAPEDVDGSAATSFQRDVYQAGEIVRLILDSVPLHTDGIASPVQSTELAIFDDWLVRATNSTPDLRFADAIQMAEAFGELADRVSSATVNQSVLDHFETEEVPYVTWPQARTLSVSARRTVYLSLASDGQQYTVKVWNGVLRGMSVATDLALVRLFEGVSRLQANPVIGLPKFFQAGISPVGPYTIYNHETGTPIDELKGLSVEAVVGIAASLLRVVDSLHGIGCSHGDIAPKNVIYNQDLGTVCLIDAFDLAPIGSAEVRTPDYCPMNWETLSREHLDRYACIKVIHDLLNSFSDFRTADVLTVLNVELQRPSIESLDPASAAIHRLQSSLTRTPIKRFALKAHSLIEGSFRSDHGAYYLITRKLGIAAMRYALTGVDLELNLEVDRGTLVDWRFVPVTFGSLAFASARGRRLELDVSLAVGDESGFADLLKYLEGVEPSAAGLAELPSRDVPDARLDVAQYWDRLTELEEEARPELEIIERLGARGGNQVYSYRSVGRPFDFDPESIVEFFLETGKRGGEIDVTKSDGATIVVRESWRTLAPGDVISLAERRDKTSFDRRRRAIRRILDRQSAITNLIDYFSLGHNPPSIDFGTDVLDSDLAMYGLNDGQAESFKYFARYGPVGLLQGPPGTGKTRFIASMVHWLVTKGGARRVLIASQSHEAVNNAIEALVSLFKRLGGRPSLLRIGSKGITERIRPYHTETVRSRYWKRFEGGFKNRVAALASAGGVKRQLSHDATTIDRELGGLARRIAQLVNLEQSAPNEDEKRRRSHEQRAANAFRKAGLKIAKRELDWRHAFDELNAVYQNLLAVHSDASMGDLNLARQILEFAHDWSDSLSSPQRNFEEFLAKTRTILTATCVGVGQTRIRIDASPFDWVIVDEAARCTPGELAVPVQLGKRVLLVGDHLQLLPMINRDLVQKLEDELPGVPREELTRSDFERAFESDYGARHGRTLNEQYRMDAAICHLVSEVFYEPHEVQLRTAPRRLGPTSIADAARKVLPVPITWIDTSQEPNAEEQREPSGTTYWNVSEAKAIIAVLEAIARDTQLVEALVSDEDETPIGVIAMYSGQKQMLERAVARHAWEARFRRLVRIDTIDAYQGKENAIVLVSLVRANRFGMAGHVSSSNRCNVAMSRAKERLIVVGSVDMWSALDTSVPIKRIISFMRLNPGSCRFVRVADLP